MVERVDEDEVGGNAFGIPCRAWLVALAAILLAGAALVLTPGPAVDGCLHSKGCFVRPHAPIGWAALSLALGSALSIWIGAVPRHWVAGWTATIAGIVGLTIGLLIAMASRNALTSDMRTWALAGGLTFFTAWLVQMPLGLIASALPSPFATRLPSAVAMHDDRPRWRREIDAALAMLEHRGRMRMTESDTQQVAELAFTLGNDTDAPAGVREHADRLRAVLASDLDGPALRNAIVQELRAALAVAARDPYRAP